ncbi:uncharacterized protein BJX67DRAFT_321757 [Aspergillus lucknowensis]|uniref:Secreted protein n=1 Tax=Aspergillus lucknowensis TaxID=176173 RepID=A0ABR4LZ33_9EURO
MMIWCLSTWFVVFGVRVPRRSRRTMCMGCLVRDVRRTFSATQSHQAGAGMVSNGNRRWMAHAVRRRILRKALKEADVADAGCCLKCRGRVTGVEAGKPWRVGGGRMSKPLGNLELSPVTGRACVPSTVSTASGSRNVM